jgi:hypothetical protein
MDWTDLAQDRDQCRALVNTVKNLRFPKMSGNSSLAERLVASQERLNYMELVEFVYTYMCIYSTYTVCPHITLTRAVAMFFYSIQK